ncbi:hypothetical protein BLNAU_1353 [Blattamonas nauphoetae]|uniref:Uncharacterized protein n=1 Tax=Blattamonas nauphoetae TaxID=2049346 RepID=A0ABQ9YJF9_9EUKA|nr:hypothetical protein BLNAU_1353 [Blattamonas nauphoetae]
MKIVFNGASCCAGFSLLCAVILAIQACGFFLQIPPGEPMTPKEFHHLGKNSVWGALIWIVVGLICAFIYYRGQKKAEKLAKEKEELEASNNTSMMI